MKPSTIPRILLVEDDAGDQELMRRALDKDGYGVELRVASNADEALEYLFHRGRYSERASAPTPGLILLDEPSQGLAPKLVQDVLDAVSKLKAEGVSVLIVEQNARSVLSVTDRVFILDHGQIVHQGPSRALLDDEDQRRALIGA